MNPEKRLNDNTCVIIMVKYPSIGQVKTRLAQNIGDKHTLELYKRFVHDIIYTLQKDKMNIQIAYTPIHQLQQFKEWLGEHLEYLPQMGGTLGERLISVVRGAFLTGVEYAVALASDAPDIPGTIISEAFKSLKKSDSVIGPSPDGGYYLIGFKKSTFKDEIFQIDAWSTGDVLNDTIKKIKEAGLTYYELPIWSDIDDIDDLKDMFQRNKENLEMESIKYLKDNMELLE
jgi:rSAM/selenodomain-associated transferase 1